MPTTKSELKTYPYHDSRLDDIYDFASDLICKFCKGEDKEKKLCELEHLLDNMED